MNTIKTVIISELEKNVDEFLNSYLEYLKYDDYDQYCTMIGLYDELTDQESISQIPTKYSIDPINFQKFTRVLTVAIYNYDVNYILAEKYKELFEFTNMDPDFSPKYRFYSPIATCSYLSQYDLISESFQQDVTKLFDRMHKQQPGCMLMNQIMVSNLIKNLLKNVQTIVQDDSSHN
nr:RNA silencing suppressor [Emaravirus tritici]